jgi:hypothetical protein
MLGAIPSIYDPSVSWIQPELQWLRAVDKGKRARARDLLRRSGAVHHLRRQVVAADQKGVGWLTIDTVRPT